MYRKSAGFIAVWIALLLLSGCGAWEWSGGDLVYSINKNKIVAHKATRGSSAVVNRKTLTVPFVNETPPAPDYMIGPNDVLFINVSGNSRFSSTFGGTITGYQEGGAAAGYSSKTILGNRVDANGDIQAPFIGLVKVGGMTLAQTQARLEGLFRKYIKHPWVTVEIVGYGSHPLYLLGEFRTPGTFYMDRPMNLLEGLTLGAGYDAMADLSGARLIRDKKTVPIDIYSLLTDGDLRQNIWLEPGDTIFIPDNKNRQVFVFGAVKHPGSVPIPPAGLSLAQAIGKSDLRKIGYDIHHVRIIRSLSATRGELIVVDFDRILRGESPPFRLREGDVIFVPKDSMGNWNDAISEMLPSLQMVSAFLQPFVDIKFLSQ
ncbi:MAG: polysaccharide biosynthesis/export family protein [Nitrospiraceae bacterium]|nr:polysaccharide biosynthesis/export family protein [Nitrospiraceae bacterium]